MSERDLIMWWVKRDTISQYGHCKACGWPVVLACCNDGDWGPHDWWVYCANKTCERHHGESVEQQKKYWVE